MTTNCQIIQNNDVQMDTKMTMHSTNFTNLMNLIETKKGLNSELSSSICPFLKKLSTLNFKVYCGDYRSTITVLQNRTKYLKALIYNDIISYFSIKI